MAVESQNLRLIAGAGVAAATTCDPITRLSAAAGTSAYDVCPDGQRFVLAEPVSAQSDVKLTVALNWMAGLKK